MRISSNRKTGQKMLLTSWVSEEDPRPGIFSLGIDPNRYELYIWKEDKPYWRSNVYAAPVSFATGFVKYDQGFSAYFGFTIEDDEVYALYTVSSNSISTRFTLTPNGQLQLTCLWVLTEKEKADKKRICAERIKNELLGFDSISTASGDAHNNAELVPFSLKSVLAATGSFSVKNKLGEGGFGSVYKGSLPGNRQVAVKRLSTKSSQGRDEFMNELKLIAKLQHTNLVRLLGCCVEDDEKILMYEYMPNRSLDKFIFDPTESVHLDGSMRFKIIEGIAQGLLYLHKYSRLRVIHRDLKASNVLLDETMTPKISDFGLARIFRMNQIEDKTNRVVGTYGYMAPEYALHGRFSEKSDAWENWMEGRGVDLIDPSMRDTCNPLQAIKCINVGLLCVQETMDERPTMSEVVVMLSNETASVPLPKKPAFTIHRRSQMLSKYSNNEVTMTNVEPR
ncbi:hypothetical protein M8C21_006208 [Ambrosia artemisiifolia]|uniref:non-specific serine/threonine protein kinase n=1 Tax=Ambrosia artemisiifolia TaxID=4212 RepID=A0AAD5CPK5_AMBAR|nr:hypothetical protein M8C21_006208 [Ambrosia artemisiifolia]